MKRLWFISFLMTLCACSSKQAVDPAPAQKENIAMKPVVLVIAIKDFQPVEYGTTKSVLQDNKITVVTASTQLGTAVARDGTKVVVDKQVADLVVSDYAGILLIGGSGAFPADGGVDGLNTPAVIRLMTQARDQKLIWGAICISPRILAGAGLFAGRTVTGWDGDKQLAGILKTAGATYKPQDVVVDGHLITAQGPHAAQAFGAAIAAALK